MIILKNDRHLHDPLDHAGAYVSQARRLRFRRRRSPSAHARRGRHLATASLRPSHTTVQRAGTPAGRQFLSYQIVSKPRNSNLGSFVTTGMCVLLLRSASIRSNRSLRSLKCYPVSGPSQLILTATGVRNMRTDDASFAHVKAFAGGVRRICQ